MKRWRARLLAVAIPLLRMLNRVLVGHRGTDSKKHEPSGPPSEREDATSLRFWYWTYGIGGIIFILVLYFSPHVDPNRPIPTIQPVRHSEVDPIFVLTHWPFELDRPYLVVACGGVIDKEHRCDSLGWEPKNEIRARVEKTNNRVLIYDEKLKSEDAKYINDCFIVDNYNWKCGSIGVANGRLYASGSFQNIPGNASSLEGQPYFLYRLGIYSLDHAMQEDGFPSRSPETAVATEQANTANGDIRAAPSELPIAIQPVAATPPAGNSISAPHVAAGADGDRSATVAEILAHGGSWMGGKLFYKTCPPGLWFGYDRLPPLKYLCPPRTTDVPATHNSTDASDAPNSSRQALGGR